MAAKPVTMPAFDFQPDDIDIEIQEAAAAVAERKTIRAGLDAWRLIGRSQSFDSWCAIGRALSIGKAHALRVTGANAAWGSAYSRVFCNWMKQHHFDRMAKSVRSVAIELVENLPAIEAWRSTLPEKKRQKLVHPLSNVAAWKKATQGKTADPHRAASLTWTRLKSLINKLPADQAMPLWQLVQSEATAHLAHQI
jgi:hypothetical protein